MHRECPREIEHGVRLEGVQKIADTPRRGNLHTPFTKRLKRLVASATARCWQPLDPLKVAVLLEGGPMGSPVRRWRDARWYQVP